MLRFYSPEKIKPTTITNLVAVTIYDLNRRNFFFPRAGTSALPVLGGRLPGWVPLGQLRLPVEARSFEVPPLPLTTLGTHIDAQTMGFITINTTRPC